MNSGSHAGNVAELSIQTFASFPAKQGAAVQKHDQVRPWRSDIPLDPQINWESSLSTGLKVDSPSVCSQYNLEELFSLLSRRCLDPLGVHRPTVYYSLSDPEFMPLQHYLCTTTAYNTLYQSHLLFSLCSDRLTSGMNIPHGNANNIYVQQYRCSFVLFHIPYSIRTGRCRSYSNISFHKYPVAHVYIK